MTTSYCAECGDGFQNKAAKAAFCSPKCRYRQRDRGKVSNAARRANGRCDCGAETPNLGSAKCRNCRSFVSKIGQLMRGDKGRTVERRPCRRCGLALSLPKRRVCLTCHRADERARNQARMADPSKRLSIRANQRTQSGKRRTVQRMTDVTPADIATLMQRTYCPTCSKRMTDEPGLPNSKHVDHIIPICIGGTHTVANLRVICRTCNLSRPIDGSDVVGQVALWQDQPAFATYVKPAKAKVHRAPRERMHCMPRAPKVPAIRKHERFYPIVSDLLEQGYGYKRIGSAIGVSRDTARAIARSVRRKNEANAQMSHA